MFDSTDELLSPDAIDELISSVSVSKVVSSRDLRKPPANTLFLSHALLATICEDIGLQQARCHNTLEENRSPSFRVQISDDLREQFGKIGLVYGNDGDLDDHYLLDIQDNGALMVKYQYIIGSRKIAQLTQAQMDRLRFNMGQALAEREGLPVQNSKALKDVKPEMAPIKRPARKAAKPVTSAPTVPEAAPVSSLPEPLKSELANLILEGNRINLPTQQLTEYPQIKKMMQNAGGKYSRSGFTFKSEDLARAALEVSQGGKIVNIKQETQFFATPYVEAVALRDELVITAGMRVLEPSAGDGALADLANNIGADVTVIENWNPNVKELEAKGYDVIERDFLTVKPEELGLFDAVMMNPPFSKRQDIAHIKHALGFLTPEGQLGAIMSPGFQTSSIKVAQQFKALLELAGAPITPIEAGAFKESGTNVSTVRILIDMPTLLDRLEQTGQSPEDFGLDLSQTLQALENQPSSRQRNRSAA